MHLYHFSDFAVARRCDEAEVESYLEGRQLLTVAPPEASVFDHAQAVLRAAVGAAERLRPVLFAPMETSVSRLLFFIWIYIHTHVHLLSSFRTHP